ncbi:hypothetical protein TNCV_3672171 [Trichonephila clavipes]|nr:hypothetical protein TNCV_3672171 [Trichonephila clavipes]
MKSFLHEFLRVMEKAADLNKFERGHLVMVMRIGTSNYETAPLDRESSEKGNVIPFLCPGSWTMIAVPVCDAAPRIFEAIVRILSILSAINIVLKMILFLESKFMT